jgi:Kef-type K+ transport system membrane component KefB
MRAIVIYSILLVAGLVLSQFLPAIAGEQYELTAHVIKVLTMFGLAFIMIHVGYEFDIDKSKLRQYGWDYVVAATAAAFPWLFCALYFIFMMSPASDWGSWDAWRESLLASRFAAPTSAGVLFSMLAAAGLSATWMFRKARTLAIFDDLDTVLLMIPLKMMMVGLRWQLGLIIILMAVMLYVAWKYLHVVRIPITYPWVMFYAAMIALASEGVYFTSKLVDEVVPIHIEVLLPAFVLGCMIAKSARTDAHANSGASHHHDDVLESPREKRATAAVSACFMVLVGLSMPALSGLAGTPSEVAAADAAAARAYVIEEGPSRDKPETQPDGAESVPDAAQPDEEWPGWGVIALHVLALTALSNLGKMFPAVCYRREAHWRERLAVAISMFPRGEVGAGVLIISLGYGIGGPMLTVAMFSLALNLVLTGVFIASVQKLLPDVPDKRQA